MLAHSSWTSGNWTPVCANPEGNVQQTLWSAQNALATDARPASVTANDQIPVNLPTKVKGTVLCSRGASTHQDVSAQTQGRHAGSSNAGAAGSVLGCHDAALHALGEIHLRAGDLQG